MLDLRIPETAKPHEVAILVLYKQLKTVRRVQVFLHYEKPQPIYRVIHKYSGLFTQQ